MMQPDLFREDKPDEGTDKLIPLSVPNGYQAGFPDEFCELLFEVSVDAYYSALYAMMSELPIREQISGFIKKVSEAADVSEGSTSLAARTSASRAASDRGDPDVLTVLNAAYKVQHEIHRLTGLLRFSPNDEGMYIARCSPDHYILPALTEHFSARFGGTPWAIIDEKRKVCLCRQKFEPPKLIPLSVFSTLASSEESSADIWQELWRLYHCSVNNESKKNLRLQRQFLPERYRKYLPEKQ